MTEPIESDAAASGQTAEEAPSEWVDRGQTDDLSAAVAAANANVAETSDATPTTAEPGSAEEPAATEEMDATPITEEPAPAEDVETAADAEEPAVAEVAAAAAAAADSLAAALEVDVPRNAVPTWPFLVYELLWVALAGAMIYEFRLLPQGTAIYDAPLYPWSVIAGVGLAALGVLLIFIVWAASLGREGASKGGLFFSALLKGSVATLAGVSIWWIALVVLDQLRLGTVL